MNKPARQPDTEPGEYGNRSDRYEVGYGRPPSEHRFQKGQSGNPNGRPKGAKNKPPRGQGMDFGTQPANQMLLEEAYRTVTIREGEKFVDLPVIKAVFRSMGVSAMKGNRLAQATMTELVRGIEEEDRQIRSSYFDTACEYKWNWEQAIAHARKHGLEVPEPIPHPDDVIVDIRKAEVRYEGPMTPEEKKRWDRMLEFRDELQADVSMHASAYRECAAMKEPPIGHMRSTAGFWERYTEMYDRINEPLPDRYRKRLQDRFYPGVSNATNSDEAEQSK
ncbi:DUF5681 domain-containing protein [Altererythrobacter arenosus]|uniref:DUF5681 domain-containing protein n=1 Tax=Altererythrobacter arenosus TaxID=3032592 RepID=A0ABY8FTW1_9SPHN|nr:DUF5681 domain-containing protein [Altererythrobacter sp. CAU 1644]WFL78272.1 DUF5681 domain-containing protein [Altererythrobacter sp. CAU 1644]